MPEERTESRFVVAIVPEGYVSDAYGVLIFGKERAEAWLNEALESDGHDVSDARCWLVQPGSNVLACVHVFRKDRVAISVEDD